MINKLQLNYYYYYYNVVLLASLLSSNYSFLSVRLFISSLYARCFSHSTYIFCTTSSFVVVNLKKIFAIFLPLNFNVEMHSYATKMCFIQTTVRTLHD